MDYSLFPLFASNLGLAIKFFRFYKLKMCAKMLFTSGFIFKQGLFVYFQSAKTAAQICNNKLR